MGNNEEKLNSIPISEVVPDYKNAMDLRGTPTSVCVCGSTVFKVNCMFDGDSNKTNTSRIIKFGDY